MTRSLPPFEPREHRTRRRKTVLSHSTVRRCAQPGGRLLNVWVMDLDIQRPIRIRGFNTRVGVRLFHVFERDLPRDVQ